MADRVLKRAGFEERLYVELAWGMRDYPHDFLTLDRIVGVMERWPGVRKPVPRERVLALAEYLSRGGRGYGATLERRGNTFRWRMDDEIMRMA